MSDSTPPTTQPTIAFDDFSKVVLKTAEVIAAEHHPNADKLLKLRIRLGDEERTICAGIRQWYAPETLVGKTIVVVANLQPRTIRGVESQGMLLAVQNGEGGEVVPLTVMKAAASGLRVS